MGGGETERAMKKADIAKLISLCEKFRAKYPDFSRVEVEHQQICGSWKQRKCSCEPTIRVFHRVVK